MKIRLATLKDSDNIFSIYSQYIYTPITFEYKMPTQKQYKKRIEEVLNFYPYLVCEEKGRIIGYGYAQRGQDREAYKWNVELSIYIDREFIAKGIGGELYSSLLDLLKRQGVRNCYARVTIPNENSEKFHRAGGFREVGIYKNTGYKDGQWRDIKVFEKAIGEYTLEPTRIKGITEICPEGYCKEISMINKKEYKKKEREQLLLNLDKLSSTKLGLQRVRKNISLESEEVIQFCKEKIEKEVAKIEKVGKNYYIKIDSVEITVNANTFTIIAAHKI